MNIFSKLVAMVLAFLLLFFGPLHILLQKEDMMVQAFVMQETSKFTDAVRNNGYLTDDMYLNFCDKLGKTGNIYDIKMTHERQVVNPIYSEDGTFENEIAVSYENTYEDDIREVLFEEAGTYYFRQGDYISISVSNRNKTPAAKMQEFILGYQSPIQIHATCGGEIKDENY